MVDTLFIIPFQSWLWLTLQNLAGYVWATDRAFVVGGLIIELLTDGLTTSFFSPTLDQFISLTGQGLLPLFLTIALFALAISYLLAPFFHIRVVDWQKAFGWFLFALLFYQAGPSLYLEAESLRREVGAEFYALVFDTTQSGVSDPAAVLGKLSAGPDPALGAPVNNFDFVASDRYVDGLDIALAYLLAGRDDVLYSSETLPAAFRDEYFDPDSGPLHFLSMGEAARAESINRGLTGIGRLALGLIVIVFGLFEQSIYLALTLASGLLFLSMSIAVLFAFFERTELMARSLVDMWLELFILSIIIAVLQAFTVGLIFTLVEQTANPTLVLGASFVGVMIMLVLLLKAWGAIWQALNRMFRAMSQTVGGGLLSPAEAGLSAAGSAAGAALTVATAGAGAAVTVAAGGSLAQVAGSALGGSDAMYNAAAMGSLVLPEGSTLKATASGFYEGALSNRMLGPAGGLLLRQPPEPASSPFASDGNWGSVAQPDPASNASNTNTVPASPVTSHPSAEIHVDTSDLAGIRQAVAAAMTQAVLAAPPGGYASPNAALGAVWTALGGAASDPALGTYLERRDVLIGRRVMQDSQAPHMQTDTGASPRDAADRGEQ